MNLWLALIFLSFAVLIWRLIRFILADADLALLAKGPLPPGTFEGKVVWITGASQGIGESLSIELAQRGARLILSARTIGRLQSVKDRCQGKYAPTEVELLPLDLAAGTAGIRSAVEKAEAAFEGLGIDYIIHNAGYPRPKMTCEESQEDFLRGMFEVNVVAPIELSRAALPGMLRRATGRLVVVSSAAGKVPSPTQGVYAASKHAINGYFHTLRYEVLKQGVGVTLVCPGPIATPTPRRLPANREGGMDAHSAAPEDKEDREKDRMTSQRCAELIIAAAGHGVEEAWISRQPVLLFLYIMQYAPWLGHLLLCKIGPKRVQALKEGHKDLYNAALLFGMSHQQKKSS